MKENWHSLNISDVYTKLDSSEKGLSQKEAERRLEKHGKNEIEEEEVASPLKIFLEQFQDFLIWILIAATVISFFADRRIDAYLILTIILANGIFGFVQDWKAEQSIQALKEMASLETVALRDGRKRKIDSIDLVPGDIIFVTQGDSVPADARLVEQQNLEVDESTLTGESLAVNKKVHPVEKGIELAERENMIYKETTVTKGRGKAVVVETSMDTEIGNIATELQKVEEEETVFQKEVNDLGKKLGVMILAICASLVPILLFRDSNLLNAFITAIALAVAAVPEGLPAVVTLTLALGTRKMLKRNALVRRLPVIESLGSVDVICTDKTGTLTESKMVVRKILFGGKEIEVSGGYSREGDFTREGKKMDASELESILEAGALCNDSEITDGETIGDPTEIALIQSAQKGGLEKESLEEKYRRIDEIPFSSERKMMTTVHEGGEGKDKAFVKGAPEVVLEKCDRYYEDGEIKELDEEKKEGFVKKNEKFADEALRVLAVAYKDLTLEGDTEEDKKEEIEERGEEEIERNLIFLGLQGMIDPPREEVKDAIKACRRAGIRTVMITGDNAVTARAIGKKLGFRGKVVTGRELETMSEKELSEKVKEADIFARVSPSHKVKILRALKDQGHVVAMTGDGVNDAPALKESDVGTSMGERGTDVAQQASDIVLLDDNFATIKNAIEEGRGIFDNIRKFVNLLLSGNMGEVLIVLIASLVGLGLPLTAVMLLWVNLLTDGLPALALGVDPGSDEIMKRKPRGQDENIIDRTLAFSIGWIGIWVTVICLSLYRYGLTESASLARTLTFTSLVVLELIEVFPIRQRYGTRLWSNRWLGAAILVSLVMHIVILYTPMRAYFKVVPLGLDSWVMISVGAVIFFGAMVLMRIIENKLLENSEEINRNEQRI
ncbi:MAG: calcium-translocating P-type ATPase, PMCA-type [Candidatus Thermoplasmatota archaeon]|nr:calcium-translocating P-type ATPase, PMCA-type [Candidatus Thermoplasmatota archaeon]MBS3789535.1 calcium-translocating P-type ATPase, PMCA-type [Candidatus Thermoplasmatota archaeon]